jgi:DNA invertase Pin-like site-specific DNA recombinase
MNAARFGYGRFFDSEDRREQHQLLTRAGCRQIFFDRSGEFTELENVRATLGSFPATSYPTLTVCSLSTAAPNSTVLVDLIIGLSEAGIGFHSLTGDWKITAESGQERLKMLHDLTAFRREIATKKSRLGVRAAEEKERHTGRPRKIDEMKLRSVARAIREGRATVAKVASEMGVSVGTLYRNLSTLKNSND